MPQILRTQYGHPVRNLPIDSKTFILNIYSGICFRMIKIIAFVLEDSHLAQHDKTMCKPARNKELPMVFLRKFYGNVLSESGASMTDVECNIQYGSLNAPN